MQTINGLKYVIADDFLYKVERISSSSSFYYILNPVKDGPLLIVSDGDIDIYNPNKQHKLRPMEPFIKNPTLN